MLVLCGSGDTWGFNTCSIALTMCGLNLFSCPCLDTLLFYVSLFLLLEILIRKKVRLHHINCHRMMGERNQLGMQQEPESLLITGWPKALPEQAAYQSQRAKPTFLPHMTAWSLVWFTLGYVDVKSNTALTSFCLVRNKLALVEEHLFCDCLHSLSS